MQGNCKEMTLNLGESGPVDESPPPKEVPSMLSSKVKYIGLDVHKEAIAIVVLNGAGKLVMESIVETKASALLDFLHGLRGELHVTLEEGTWAAWLYDVLKPHVQEIVVCNPRRNALLKEGSKGDKIDARKLAELLRSGMLRAVYHGENGLRTLRELARSYQVVSKDLKRVMKPSQGVVSKLGYRLYGYAGLYTSLSRAVAEQDCASRRTSPRRAVLSTAGWIAGPAPHGARRIVGREPEASIAETATPESLHRPASSRSPSGPDADATSVPD